MSDMEMDDGHVSSYVPSPIPPESDNGDYTPAPLIRTVPGWDQGYPIDPTDLTGAFLTRNSLGFLHHPSIQNASPSGILPKMGIRIHRDKMFSLIADDAEFQMRPSVSMMIGIDDKGLYHHLDIHAVKTGGTASGMFEYGISRALKGSVWDTDRTDEENWAAIFGKVSDTCTPNRLSEALDTNTSLIEGVAKATMEDINRHLNQARSVVAEGPQISDVQMRTTTSGILSSLKPKEALIEPETGIMLIIDADGQNIGALLPFIVLSLDPNARDNASLGRWSARILPAEDDLTTKETLSSLVKAAEGELTERLRYGARQAILSSRAPSTFTQGSQNLSQGDISSVADVSKIILQDESLGDKIMGLSQALRSMTFDTQIADEMASASPGLKISADDTLTRHGLTTFAQILRAKEVAREATEGRVAGMGVPDVQWE